MAEPPTDDSKKLLVTAKWGDSEEELLAKWADKATCYRWMHDKAEKMYTRWNMAMTIPVIVLSTLTGTANFGLSSMVPPDLQSYAQLGIGGVSLITGMISTIANFLRYAQGMEAHRGAAISWGKLHRKISVELSLPRDQREVAMDFLLVCRSELDRLIEQSPSIPDEIVDSFTNTFPGVELTAPVKWNDLEKTVPYVPKHDRTAQIIADAGRVFKGDYSPSIQRMKETKKSGILAKLVPRLSPRKEPEIEVKPEIDVTVDVPVVEEKSSVLSDDTHV